MDASRYRKWTHFSITDALPGRAWGTGKIGLGGFTGNGRLDVAVSRREPQTAYWFERTDDGTWVRHVIGQSEHLARTLGAAVLDIDHDGWLDIAFSRVWFRNPGCLADDPDAPWEAVPYDGGGHDIVAAGINGDGHAHQTPEAARAMVRYYTAARIKEALQEAEAAGITTPIVSRMRTSRQAVG